MLLWRISQAFLMVFSSHLILENSCRKISLYTLAYFCLPLCICMHVSQQEKKSEQYLDFVFLLFVFITSEARGFPGCTSLCFFLLISPAEYLYFSLPRSYFLLVSVDIMFSSMMLWRVPYRWSLLFDLKIKKQRANYVSVVERKSFLLCLYIFFFSFNR